MKIKYFKFNELVIIGMGAIFNRILCAFNYQEKYVPLKREIFGLLKNNIKIVRKNNNILILKSINNFDNKFLLRLRTSDIPVFNQVVIEEEYLPIIDIVKKKYDENQIKIIVDAGANIGLTSIFFNSYFNQAKIIAIEPEESNFKQLAKNIKTNKIENRVIAINKALWVNSTDKLSISNEFRDGQNWAKSVKISDSKNKIIKPITIKELLDNYAKNQTIDILKIDIEGAEAVLFNSLDFINVLVHSVRFLCFEIHEEFMKKELFYKILSENNFDFIDIDETTFCFNKQLV